MSNMTIDPNARMPIGNTQTAAQLAGGSNDGKVKDKTTTLTREITSLAQRAITVLTTNRAQTQQTTGASGTTGVPVLDDPEDPKALLQDLERLVAFLQLDNDQRQSEMARARIENQQGVMDKEHRTRLDKIDESIKAAKKAEKAAKASRVLGWLGAIVAVAAAIVVTAVTGGAAAGFAIAGAALAVTQLVLSETGAADKIIDKMAESMQKNFGLSKADAKAWAAGVYSAIFVVLGLASAGVGIGMSAVSAAKATADTISTTAKVALFATQVVNIGMGLTGAVTGGVQTSLNYKASEASAEVSDVNRYMAVIQQLLEESEEELEQIMNQIQALFSQLVAIIQSKTDTGNMIVENMTQMI
jgi:hypothetical protein